MRAAMFLITGLLLCDVTASAQTQPQREAGTSVAVRDAANRHYRLGLNYLANEYWAEAVREFSQATTLDDRFALAYYGLGRAHIGMKRFQPAIAALTQCRSIFLDIAATATNDAFSRNQRRQEQIMELRESLRELSGGPQSVSRQRTIDNVQDQLHELEQAPSFNANLTARAPAFVTLSLGSAYFRTEDFANAEEYYLEAAQANPRMGEVHNNLAVVYYELGRYDEANKRVKLAEKYGYKVSSLFKEALKTAQLPSR